MRSTRRTLLKAAGPLVAASASPARAQAQVQAQVQAWPSRPVRIIVGTAAGGSPDIVSRMLGEKFSERLGQSFVVENNTQGAGIVAEQAVNKSAPDGHTMVMLTAGYPGRHSIRSRASRSSRMSAATRSSIRSRPARRSNRSGICSTAPRPSPTRSPIRSTRRDRSITC
jgi:hypothetical protein